MLINQSVIADIQAIIHDAKDKAIRLVDHERTLMYWQIGQRIFEEEQQGKDRADYGHYLTEFIADRLEPEYGVLETADRIIPPVLPHIPNCERTAFAIGLDTLQNIVTN